MSYLTDDLDAVVNDWWCELNLDLKLLIAPLIESEIIPEYKKQREQTIEVSPLPKWMVDLFDGIDGFNAKQSEAHPHCPSC